MRSRHITALAAGTSLLFFGACTQIGAPGAPPTEARVADEADLRLTVARFEKAIALRDIEAILSFYTADAWQLPQNGPIARTADERRAFWTSVATLPVVTDTVTVADRIEMARSGELAVMLAEFRQITTDSKGASTSLPQKFITVWREEPDGTWKVAGSMATIRN